MLFVVPAVALVGEIVPLPSPSAEFVTVTVGEAPIVVSVPPLVDFSCTVQVAAPVCEADGSTAPLLPPLVSP